MPAVRNSKLATLSALEMVAGDMRPLMASPRLDGGRGIAIELVDAVFCFGGSAGVASFNSENRSPSVIEFS